MLLVSMVTVIVPVLMTLTFTTFAGTGGVLTPRRVFTALSIVFALRIYAVTNVNWGLFYMLESLVAVSRIKVGHVTDWNL